MFVNNKKKKGEETEEKEINIFKWAHERFVERLAFG